MDNNINNILNDFIITALLLFLPAKRGSSDYFEQDDSNQKFTPFRMLDFNSRHLLILVIVYLEYFGR
jgi:hypothetical protein